MQIKTEMAKPGSRCTAEVVVVGSCNMDLISYVADFPKLGETVHGTDFQMGFGGKGANQAAACAKLQACTYTIGKLGGDVFGKQFRQHLTENMVNTEYVYSTEVAATGVASIWVDKQGCNAIVIASGANLLLTPADIEAAENLIRESSVVVCQLEVTQEAVLAALKMAKKHKARTIFNPAPAETEMNLDIYQYCDIICPNETEVEILTGIKIVTLEDAARAVDVLLDRGVSVAVITLGERGAVFSQLQDRQLVHVQAESATAVDSVGAGDAFVGALAVALAKGVDTDFEKAVRFACHYATQSVQRLGSQASFSNLEELSEEWREIFRAAS